MTVTLELPAELSQFSLPDGVQARLRDLLDRQDSGKNLSKAETKEAEGLVELAESLTLLKLRATPSS